MKVLNRPMFRYGGPIKEGIMSGIKEPRRQGYAQPPGFVIQNDPNKMITNKMLQNAEAFMKAGQVYDQDLNNQAFTLSAPNKVNQVSAFDKMKKNTQFGNQNPFVQPDTTMSKEEKLIEAYKPDPKNPFRGLIDYTSEVNTYTDSEGNKRSRKTGEIIRDTDISEVITEPRGGGADMSKIPATKPDVKLPGDDPDPPAPNKKERVNTILESLGYDRAQKNALYDAMIKAGQRVSRGGLGAENLVSDVIAETSQSYDKPEKLREAANLMDAQQQLKLEQIEASKDTRSPMQKNADYFLESGVAKNTEDAIRMARNLPVTVSETFQTKVKEFGKSEGLVQTAIDLSERGQFGNLEFEGKIDKKYKGKDLSEFLASPGFKGDGVYTADGKILVIQNGDIKQTINVRGSVEDSLFNFGGEK